MMRTAIRRRAALLALAGLWGLMTTSVRAADPPAKHPPEHTMRRAGHPQRTAPWAIATPTARYVPYYVGGGTIWHGDDRLTSEGTWGMDYRGSFFKRRIMLDGSHGRRYQGGTGSYKTFGPKVPVVGPLKKL